MHHYTPPSYWGDVDRRYRAQSAGHHSCPERATSTPVYILWTGCNLALVGKVQQAVHEVLLWLQRCGGQSWPHMRLQGLRWLCIFLLKCSTEKFAFYLQSKKTGSLEFHFRDIMLEFQHLCLVTMIKSFFVGGMYGYEHNAVLQRLCIRALSHTNVNCQLST